jgi:hypothetical protein
MRQRQALAVFTVVRRTLKEWKHPTPPLSPRPCARAKKGDLTFRKSEIRRIAATLDRLATRCGEAYQVVGTLASEAGLGNDRAVLKALDILCDPLSCGEILSFSTPTARKPVGVNKRPRAKAGSSSRPGPAKRRKG